MPRTVQDLLLEPLPNLIVGPGHTQSSAIHRIRFTEELGPWRNFRTDVTAAFQQTHWNQSQILPRLFGNPFMIEHGWNGDEHDVEGRFKERIGLALSLFARVQNLDFRIGGFKSIPTNYTKVPDFIIFRPPSPMPPNGPLLVAGEIKTPWVNEHELSPPVSDAQRGSEQGLRRYLGQIAEYMHDLGLKYGVLTTYNETLFLRQVIENRRWKLEFSPVINHTDIFPAPSSVTLRMCFIYIALLSLEDSAFDKGGLRTQRWTEWSSRRS